MKVLPFPPRPRIPTPMPPEVSSVEFSILPSGAVVTQELGANTDKFRRALLAWCVENGEAPDGKLDAYRLGRLLSRAPCWTARRAGTIRCSSLGTCSRSCNRARTAASPQRRFAAGACVPSAMIRAATVSAPSAART